MSANLEDIVQALVAIGKTTIVNCPVVPVRIPDVGENTYTTLDTFGKIVKLKVPKRGEIRSAIYYDLDYEGLQTKLHIFNKSITQIAPEDAWAPSDADILNLVTTLDFVAPTAGHTNSYTFELTNIGKAYTAPEGFFWIQAQCVGAQDMASAEVYPRFKIQIQSFDPDFKEV